MRRLQHASHARRATSSAAESGFSLVELLVIVGIIAILISMLMPAVASMRARANEIKCQSQLRTIGQAAQLHANDHNGYLPIAGRHWDVAAEEADNEALKDERGRRYIYYDEDGKKRPVPITVALAISLGAKVRLDSREVLEEDMQTEAVRKYFECPAQEVKLRGMTQSDMNWSAPWEWSGYIFNEAILGMRDKKEIPDPPLGKVTQIRRPSSVMFAMDGRPRTFTGDTAHLLVFDLNPHYTLWDFQKIASNPELTWCGKEGIDFLRHRWRANIVFVDGHVESVALTKEGMSRVGLSQGPS
jgi:prepilin-type processing-associated H-X9-DG protein